MKIYSWNVNGIRSVFEKGFLNWLEKENPDIICLQEIKADGDDLDRKYTKIDGYYFYFNSAKKKGYAGTAIYSKIKLDKVECGIGLNEFDNDGRVMKIFFDNYVIYNLYIPNGSKDKSKHPYKLNSLNYIIEDIKTNKVKNKILLGDFNIAHTEKDIANPEHNIEKNTFTTQERSVIDQLLNLNFIDSFRYKNPDGYDKYTCWDYAANQRMMNIGWRYDYVFINSTLLNELEEVYILSNVLGSDHCPVGIKLKTDIKIEEGPVYPKDTLF